MEPISRKQLIKIGFVDTQTAIANLNQLAELLSCQPNDLIAPTSKCANPDGALSAILGTAYRDTKDLAALLKRPGALAQLYLLLGASDGFAAFFFRHPEELRIFPLPNQIPSSDELFKKLLSSVEAKSGFAAHGGAASWISLRVAYRVMLAQIALFDLSASDPRAVMPAVSEALSDAAGAALEASLATARSWLVEKNFASRSEVEAVRLAIIGMGKTGARELNYVSDVDVIFVADSAKDEAGGAILTETRLIDIATRLASLAMRGISDVEIEPGLWEVDANLRPEGKQGALVRTLESHLNYYDRWAKSWEFQALLKARAIAGDLALGEEYVTALSPKVWGSSAREQFVESVQRMRERVTEHIPKEQLPFQIKLGPGGIRDIEFTVQLLQLVHGATDESIHQGGTLAAITALSEAGYIGREDAALFAEDYRTLRVLEHRLQLRKLSRTHLVPQDENEQRIIARASGLVSGAPNVWQIWEQLKIRVREIHTKLFYRPLLSAVAALGEEERLLSAAQAEQRLAAVGFKDPSGALRHIQALSSGITRKAAITKHLMPVMIQWLAEGDDPDYGLLAFRRISERLGEASWFLRLLRDSPAAAARLTRLLSSSRFIGDLMEWNPETVSWVDDEEQLRLRSREAIAETLRQQALRHINETNKAFKAVRTVRRRELLRIAMNSVIGTVTIEEVAMALSDLNDAVLDAALRISLANYEVPEDFEFAIIAMGRYGGQELGFGSDADVLFVYRAESLDADAAARLGKKVVIKLREGLEDALIPFELDADLRPEGKQGALARSLDSYAEYYRRWSLSWEAQALLRARFAAGDSELGAAFISMTDELRYRSGLSLNDIREIKRLKARVENERLPQGAEPTRHLKLGPGSLSDVEWLVQLWQLQYAKDNPELKTTSTLAALAAAQNQGLVSGEEAELLREAWLLASRLRSATTLLSRKTSDVLSKNRQQLSAVGRLLNYPPLSASQVEQDYLAATRKSRKVFERLFYDS